MILLNSQDALRREIETRKAEWLSKMEEAKVRETELKEKICDLQLREEEKNERMKQCEEREMRALQRGAEEEREIHRVEVEEYREQVRQHAFTIVAMEKQINKVQQSEDRWREMENQRDSLEEQLKGENFSFTYRYNILIVVFLCTLSFEMITNINL